MEFVAFFTIPCLLQWLLILASVTVIVCMALPPPKRQRKVLTLEKKKEILDKLDSGWPIRRVSQYYDVSRTTLQNIRKSGDAIRAYQGQYGQTSRRMRRKTMAKPKYQDLDQACLKWYHQQLGNGVMVRAMELKAAAEKFAIELLNIPDFKTSEGWLNCFKLRHGLSNKNTYGEPLDALEVGVDEFRGKLKMLIEREGLNLNDIYNVDETGLYYRSLPTNTSANEKEKSVPRRKLSAMCGANATGTHRLRPVIVGTAQVPRCLQGMMDRLPVVYFNSVKDGFTRKIFSDWFFNHAVEEIIQYQTETLGVAHENVRALILLDNAPVHLSEKELVGAHGRIRCMFLPANTTSILQPMDQGIVAATKRIYRQKFLSEVMVVLEEDEELATGIDTRRAKTLDNLKKYNLKSAIFNWAQAWKDIKISTLENGWKRILKAEEPIVDFEGFEVHDFHKQLKSAGAMVYEDAILNWLESDEGDPGYQTMTDQEIAASVAAGSQEDDEDDEDVPDIPKLNKVKEALDLLIEYMEHPNANTALFRPHSSTLLREGRDSVIKVQQRRHYKQATIKSFFCPASTAHSTDPQPLVVPDSNTPSSDPQPLLVPASASNNPATDPQPSQSPITSPSLCLDVSVLDVWYDDDKLFCEDSEGSIKCERETVYSDYENSIKCEAVEGDIGTIKEENEITKCEEDLLEYCEKENGTGSELGSHVHNHNGEKYKKSTMLEEQLSNGEKFKKSTMPEKQLSNEEKYKESTMPEKQLSNGEKYKKSTMLEEQLSNGEKYKKSTVPKKQLSDGEKYKKSTMPEEQLSDGEKYKKSTMPDEQLSNKEQYKKSETPAEQFFGGSSLENQCHICKKPFKCSRDLKEHLTTHTVQKHESEMLEVQLADNQCHICKRQFNRKCDLGEHLVTHIWEKKFQSQLCQDGFSSLKQHLSPVVATTSTASLSTVNSRRKFTAAFKIKVAELAEKSNNCAAAREFDVSKKIVRDWRKMLGKLREMPKTKCANRGKPCRWSWIEEETVKFVDENLKNGIAVSRGDIQTFALKTAKAHGLTKEDFTASQGWVTRFVRRHNYSLGRRTKKDQRLLDGTEYYCQSGDDAAMDACTQDDPDEPEEEEEVEDDDHDGLVMAEDWDEVFGKDDDSEGQVVANDFEGFNG